MIEFWNAHPPGFTHELLTSLPRRYAPLRDGVFWVFALLNFPWLLTAYGLADKLWREDPGAWPIYAVVALALAQPLLLWWLAADTHRWAVPNRNFYLAACVLVSGFVIGYYLGKLRPEWLMHVEKERYRLDNEARNRAQQGSTQP